MLPRKRGFPTGYCVWPVDPPNVPRNGRGVSADEYNDQYEQEEETQKEDGARDLPRPETVLDYADAVLAVGERRCGH